LVFILIATEPVLKNTAKYHSEFAMLERTEHYALHDLRALHIIELSKLPPGSSGRLAAWLQFMLTRKKEDLMALVKKHPELQPAGKALVSASTEAAIRAWLAHDRTHDMDTLDRIDYAVQEAKREARNEKRRAVAAERRKAKDAVEKAEVARKKAEVERKKAENAVEVERKKAENAVEVERRKAENAVEVERKKAEKMLTMIKQGYSVKQVEKMFLKK